MNKTTEYDLEKLLLEYNVKIPSIQRDYAFGRTDTKNKTKREKFLNKLIQAVLGEKRVHLDFVYGEQEDTVFILLDGQQRITTLWLLDLYLSLALKEEVQLIKPYLANFTYDSRTSTREFCQALLKGSWRLPDLGSQSVSDYFYEQKWFFNSWRQDPTITGMCNVLNDIHSILKGKDLKNAKIDNITFSFLDVYDLGQPEELYVKMNSRGKQLSDWDLFKADLFEYIEEENWFGFEGTTFEKWIDGEFLDYFWSLGTEGQDKAKNTEQRMLRFFYLLLFIERLDRDSTAEEGLSETKETEKANEVLDSVIQDWRKIIDARFLNHFQTFTVFIKENRKDIEHIEFSRFSNKGLRFDELITILLKTEISGFMADIDLVYAYYRFAVQQEDETIFDQNELKQRIRIISNFEEPYRKQFSIMKVYLKEIRKAFDHPQGTLDYFATKNLTNARFGAHSEEQKNEEVVKAKLLLEKPDDWASKIYEAENNQYFNGTIGWLLRVSNSDFMKFDFYSNKLLKKFDKNGIIERTEIANILRYKNIRLGDLFPRNLNAGDGAKNLLRDSSWKKLFRDAVKKNELTQKIDVT